MTTASKLIDPLISPTAEFLNDPFPTYARFRNEAPVWWSPKGKYWLVTRYAEANAILGDLTYEKRLDKWKQISPIVRVLPAVRKAINARSQWMLNMNPPDHTRMRGLVNKAFTPSTVAGLAPHIESIANELIDHVKEKGEMDLIHDFAFPLPVIVIAQMLGVPTKDRELFRKFSHMVTSTIEITPGIRGLDEGNRGVDGLVAYLRPLVAERRKNPQEDLISALITAEEQGNHLTEDELLHNCVLLLVAGHETTVNLIGNCLLDLLRFPDQMALVKADVDKMIPLAVQETLRFDSPVQMARRLAGKDVELCGQKLKKGEMISVMLGAANHDPAVYDNPDVFDIQRAQKRNLAFGQGIHHCLGSSLAETEGRIALSVMLKRLPELKLKNPDKLDWRQSVVFRGVTHLPATF